MYLNFRQVFVSLAILFSVNTVFGQQNTRSPYSLFGVGLLHYDGFADNAANGRNGYSYRNVSNYSFANPSSLSALKYSVFNVSPYMDLGKFKTNSGTQNFSNAGFNYIALAVPISNLKSGLAFGLLPFSDVGYNIINDKDSSRVSIRNEFEGSGGLSKFNIGWGTHAWKYLSVGANYSRIFGQIHENQRRRYPANRLMTSYADNNDIYLKGSHVDLGLQFHTDSDTGLSQVLGLVFSGSTRLKGERDRFFYTFTEIYEGQALPKDTLIDIKGEEAKVILPRSLNASYSIGKREKWQITAGYGKTLWSQYQNIFGDNGGLSNDQNYSLGVFICPTPDFDNSIKANKFGRYLNSIRYTVGYYHNDGYITAFDSKIAENGIGIGLGFPFTKSNKNYDGTKSKITSRIFVTGQFIRRGTLKNNLIQEDFLKITVGLNLADKWFNKRLFN